MPIVGGCRAVPFISVPVAGRRCAYPAYISAQGECRPGKAQPPPGIEAGTALDVHCRWLPDGTLQPL